MNILGQGVARGMGRARRQQPPFARRVLRDRLGRVVQAIAKAPLDGAASVALYETSSTRGAGFVDLEHFAAGAGDARPADGADFCPTSAQQRHVGCRGLIAGLPKSDRYAVARLGGLAGYVRARPPTSFCNARRAAASQSRAGRGSGATLAH